MLIFSYLHVYWLVSKSKTWNWIDMMTYFNIFGSQQYYKLIGASRWKHKVVYEEEELRSKYKEAISYKTANVYYSFLVHTRCFQAVLLSKEKRTFQHVSSKISLTYSFKQLKQFPTPELIDNLPVNCFQGLSENVKSLFLCVSKPHTGEGGEDSLTENLLEPGYLEEDYAVRTFFANKRFSNKGPIKFIDFRSVFGGVR